MIAFLADENFNRNIVRGVMGRTSEVEIILAQDAGLGGASDEELLAWAVQHQCLVLSHDVSTLLRAA